MIRANRSGQQAISSPAPHRSLTRLQETADDLPGAGHKSPSQITDKGEFSGRDNNPRAGAGRALLRPSATQSHCPYKGTASYWSLDTGAGVHQDSVWIYRSPLA